MEDFSGTSASFLDRQPHESKMSNKVTPMDHIMKAHSEHGKRLEEVARSGLLPRKELIGNEE